MWKHLFNRTLKAVKSKLKKISMNSLKETTEKLVKDFKIKSDNENGQNFLVDENVLNEEIKRADLKKPDIVLDIGAGFGSIESKVKEICRVIAIEKEIKCYSYLLDKYEVDPNVEVINSDALDIVYPEFNKIITNPPYNIVDRIMNKLLFYNFEQGIMIIPNTIAEHLLLNEAENKFSAIQKIFFNFEEIQEIKKEAFYPVPRVTSRMIKMVKKPSDVLQEIFKRDEMTLKNAILRGLQTIKNNTKRESLYNFNSLPDEIKSMNGKQVKTLQINEIKTLMKYFS